MSLAIHPILPLKWEAYWANVVELPSPMFPTPKSGLFITLTFSTNLHAFSPTTIMTDTSSSHPSTDPKNEHFREENRFLFICWKVSKLIVVHTVLIVLSRKRKIGLPQHAQVPILNENAPKPLFSALSHGYEITRLKGEGGGRLKPKSDFMKK
uniref:Uncharacterized protein n=1 Tax=Cucumis melo TaxID=3656 RepID=A0A9I9EEG5_CUCME